MKCPECLTPYSSSPDTEGIRDCHACGLWTLPVFWQPRNDTDYRELR